MILGVAAVRGQNPNFNVGEHRNRISADTRPRARFSDHDALTDERQTHVATLSVELEIGQLVER